MRWLTKQRSQSVKHIQEEQEKERSRLNDDRRQIQDALTILTQSLKGDASALYALRQLQSSQLQNDASLDAIATTSQIPDNFSSSILGIMSRRHEEKMIDFQSRIILESLRFEDMPNRHEAIPTAYQRTFDWIYKEPDDHPESRAMAPSTVINGDTSSLLSAHQLRMAPQWDSFVKWLRSTEDLYWITGKPGAGKSTLMKFIYHQSRTQENLNQWAIGLGRSPMLPSDYGAISSMLYPDRKIQRGPANLVETAAFFFWNSGSKLQMSRIGFLRTIVFQLLEDYPHLIPEVFADRWSRYELLGGDLRPFSWVELTKALDVITSDMNRLFFILVDGLDEFDGKSSDLADYVLEVSSRSNVKICAASRPWLAFEDKFEGHPKLRVEELSRHDILTYITGNFEESKRFTAMQKYKPQAAQKLIQEVADRASGVFLWVYVVMGSLVEGLRDGDDIPQLEQRLRDLPTELEDLFERILHRLDPAYAKEASEMFQFVRDYPEATSLISMYLSNSPISDALNLRLDPIPNSELQFHEDSMRRRVYSRCKCLLEVTNPPNRRPLVTFLHRTVRDYLQDPEVWKDIENNSPHYESRTALVVSYVLQAKTRITCTRDNWKHEACRLHLCLAEAYELVKQSDELPIDSKIGLFAQLDQIDKELPIAGRLGNLNFHLDHTWHDHYVGVSSFKVMALPPKMRTFMLAIFEDLDWYVSVRIDQDPSLLKETVERRPLLDFCAIHQKWKAVSILLTKGIGSGDKDAKGFAWRKLQETALLSAIPLTDLFMYTRVIGLFLSHGVINSKAQEKDSKDFVHHCIAEVARQDKEESEMLAAKWKSATKTLREKEGPRMQFWRRSSRA